MANFSIKDACVYTFQTLRKHFLLLLTIGALATIPEIIQLQITPHQITSNQKRCALFSHSDLFNFDALTKLIQQETISFTDITTFLKNIGTPPKTPRETPTDQVDQTNVDQVSNAAPDALINDPNDQTANTVKTNTDTQPTAPSRGLIYLLCHVLQLILFLVSIGIAFDLYEKNNSSLLQGLKRISSHPKVLLRFVLLFFIFMLCMIPMGIIGAFSFIFLLLLSFPFIPLWIKPIFAFFIISIILCLIVYVLCTLYAKYFFATYALIEKPRKVFESLAYSSAILHGSYLKLLFVFLLNTLILSILIMKFSLLYIIIALLNTSFTLFSISYLPLAAMALFTMIFVFPLTIIFYSYIYKKLGEAYAQKS